MWSFLQVCLAIFICLFFTCLGIVIYGLIDHFYKIQPLISKAKTLEVTPLTERGFSSSRIPPGIDVIIVGSGMGGLTTAALLARRGAQCFPAFLLRLCAAGRYSISVQHIILPHLGLLLFLGKKVLLLEQHDKLGGCTHSFDEKGFEFDCGLHVSRYCAVLGVRSFYFLLMRCFWRC
jgi:hypothetical protein